jgi:hypothetical protein
MWLKEEFEKYVFNILFWLSITILIAIFISNLLSGSKGSYTDHTDTIWNLMGKKYEDKYFRPPERSALGSTPRSSKGETECRRVIENITGKTFKKARPPFLQNNVSGQNLELDCYNEDLNLAIEYNGEQHYKFTPYFHPNKDAYYNLRYRDEMKQRLCKENGVNLIIVPYTVKNENIESFIKKQLNDG